jgi:hypothetical protein
LNWPTTQSDPEGKGEEGRGRSRARGCAGEDDNEQVVMMPTASKQSVPGITPSAERTEGMDKTLSSKSSQGRKVSDLVESKEVREKKRNAPESDLRLHHKNGGPNPSNLQPVEREQERRRSVS